ncbi:AsnC family transcriptional regulator [Paenarthrobacter sp. NPDC089714]|uniref:AsnC family transcriptional regulator n=1 Tax=Paenarthrobacter sp. NPDC089714 TaxID=3364377 RepID=UPI0037F67717
MPTSPPESATITELDLEIAGALEVNPRADWTLLGRALGVSASTVGRRWAYLQEHGLAWVTVAPGERFLSNASAAFINLSVKPSRYQATIEHLCSVPEFATVSMVSGAYDVQLDCFAHSNEQLMATINTAFENLKGISSRNVIFLTVLYRHGSQWSSGSLAPDQAQLIRQRGMEASGPGLGSSLQDRLLSELARNGRASWSDLAAACAVSAQTARRRVERYLATGYFSLRCDTSPALQAGRREISLGLNVPAPHVEVAGHYFSSLSSCRVSAQVLGSENLTVTLRVRDYAEVQYHEKELHALAPGSTVVSRQAVIRTYKRMGHLLDANGHRQGFVPLPLWA